MFASADFLAQGRSPSLDQTVPRQLKLRSKKSRTQLLSSPLILRHQEKIKEAAEPTQSTLSSPEVLGCHPHPPRTPKARPQGPALRLRCSLGHTASTFSSGERTFLLRPGLCYCQPRTQARAPLPPCPSSPEHSSPNVPPHVRGLLSSLLFGVLGGQALALVALKLF